MNPAAPRRYFDVAPPGKAAPSPTSRPVITRTPAPDPLLQQKPAQPITARPQIAADTPAPHAVTAPAPAPDVDPAALLIQAGDFTPLKASKGRPNHVALVIMTCVLVVLCAVTYWLVSTM